MFFSFLVEVNVECDDKLKSLFFDLVLDEYVLVKDLRMGVNFDDKIVLLWLFLKLLNIVIYKNKGVWKIDLEDVILLKMLKESFYDKLKYLR